MILFIAEKPSMAIELSKCMPGPVRRRDGYIETGGGLITWSYGHILRQAEPDEYEDKYKKWQAVDLPIIPQKWKLVIADSCQKQFEVIRGLIAQAAEIVHAGDPDREGQLLIDEILEYVDNTKPVKRILLNALDEKSIKKALAMQRNNKDFYRLKQSALGRSRADWLVGMNLSRAYTLSARRAGHDGVFPVGRVKTPTLALVVRREREIQDFQPVDYFLLKAEFKGQNEAFMATWKAQDNQQGLDSEGRLVDAQIAEQLMNQFRQATESARVVACEIQKKKEPQRLPFSLSGLQILAGKRFGYDPQTVLAAAQSLYEKKLTTYPRSDCEFLPESQYSDAKAILFNLHSSQDTFICNWAAKADVKVRSRAWNDKKITAHHAIIPTEVPCNLACLTEIEKNIYILVAQAYIAQFYPVHVYKQTKITLEYLQESFIATGRVIVEMGWKEVYKADYKAEDDDSRSLPALNKSDEVEFVRGIIDKKVTKPPVRFTASTLLQAMKEIHKYVRNPELKKQLKDVAGIGTEATRATIIKELTVRKFLTQNKKYLYPTEAAYLLIDVLPEELTYPDYTAMWESTFDQMVEGNVPLDEFIKQQIQFITELCAKANQISPKNLSSNAKLCPRCQQGVLKLRNGKHGLFWGCSRFPQCRATFDNHEGQPLLKQ